MPILRWLTRDDDIHKATQAPYRLLEEMPELSQGERDTGNMLIQGDNLEALKALLPYYAGKVKCIFIDPPYNTRSAFEHYDDNLEHTKWLAMMYPRLELLRELLAEDGSIWVTIDDNEAHYLKVIMDEIFGRKNFVANVIWEKRTSRENRRVFSFNHDHIFVYGKNKQLFERIRNTLELSAEVLSRYKNPDNDPRGVWQSVAITAQSGHGTPSQFYAITTPSGRKIDLPPGNCWRFTKERLDELIQDNRIYFGPTGNNVPRQKKFLSDTKESSGLTPETIWPAKEVGTNDDAKKGLIQLLPNIPVFDNPKPESLIERVIHIATIPNDLVLDSFLGSGTTAAVAHKMGRRYIGIEMGDHAITHCVPRLRKVIEGEQGGISEAVGWKGGGGFRFYRLGVPVFDENGHVADGVRFGPLAAHIWFLETGIPYSGKADSPFLGSHEGIGYYLLFNGILGDKRPDGGNILTLKILAGLPKFDGPKVVFGEGCRLGKERLEREDITFRHIPYEIQAR